MKQKQTLLLHIKKISFNNVNGWLFHEFPAKSLKEQETALQAIVQQLEQLSTTIEKKKTSNDAFQLASLKQNMAALLQVSESILIFRMQI